MTSTATFQISTTKLPDGPHSLRILARDFAGTVVEATATFIIDTLGPRPAQLTPSGTNLGGPRELVVVLAQDQIVADNVARATNWVLQASGGDAVFGDANAYTIPLFDQQITYDAATRTVRITLPAPLPEDFYRLVIKGSGPDVIRDLAGNPFNDGKDFVHPFVVLDPPAVAHEPEQTFSSSSQPIDLVAVDLDADGRDDLVSVDRATGVLTVALNRDGAEWRSITAVNLGVGSIHGLAAGDFNEDGKADLLLQGPTSLFLALGNGQGGFTLGQTLTAAGLAAPANQERIGLLAADVTGDGHRDAVVLAAAAGQVLVFAGDGTGNFAAPMAYRHRRRRPHRPGARQLPRRRGSRPGDRPCRPAAR